MATLVNMATRSLGAAWRMVGADAVKAVVSFRIDSMLDGVIMFDGDSQGKQVGGKSDWLAPGE